MDTADITNRRNAFIGNVIPQLEKSKAIMIYHYTSIENLALILKNKTIRFSRLDKVDDMREIEGLPLAFSTYVFISCWTYDKTESIPLWKMYTNNMQGVRLSLPKEMFKIKTTKSGRYQNRINIEGDIKCPLTIDEMVTDKYMIVNQFQNKDSFYKKVSYDNKYPEYYRDSINIGNGDTHIKNMFQFGKYKKKDWKFQKESRFTIYAIPLLGLEHPLVKGNPEKQLELLNYSVNKHLNNNTEFIDLELDEDVINNIHLILGPRCSESDKIIVESLLNKYTENGKIDTSNLTGTIRF